MKSLIVAFWLLMIIVATSWFFFFPGMFYLHDYLHTARIAEVTRALQDGHFPVRWSQNFGYGYGMPLFEFYAPLPFYVGSLFALVGLPLVVTTKLLFILCNIFTTLGSYLLGKSVFGRMGGLLTAAAISLAPYRAVNIYVRGALSEAWGIMAIVWIIYFLYQTAKGSRPGWLGLTLSLTILFLSHNLLTLLFVPFSIAIAVVTMLYFYSKNKKHFWKKVWQLIAAYALSVGLATFYMVPAFFEKNFTQVQDVIVGGYFDYSLHFIYLRQFFMPTWGYGGSNWGPEDGISFFLGYGQLLSLLLSAIFIFTTGYRGLNKSWSMLSQAKWWWMVSVGCLFLVALALSTGRSQVVWQNISVLQFVQFPWRFLSIALVLLGLLAPIFLFAQHSFVKRWFAGWLVLLVFFVNALFFRPSQFMENPAEFYTGDSGVIQSELSKVLPDYLPTHAQKVATPPNAIAMCEGECLIENIYTNKVHKKEVQTVALAPSTITFAVNNFPGWKASVNSTNADILEQNGLITVNVPEGNHLVSLEFGSTQLRSTTDMVSLASLIAFLAAYYFGYLRKYEKR